MASGSPVDLRGAPDRSRQDGKDGSAGCGAGPTSCRVRDQSAPLLPGHIGSRWAGSGSWGGTAVRAARGSRELARGAGVSLGGRIGVGCKSFEF